MPKVQLRPISHRLLAQLDFSLALNTLQMRSPQVFSGRHQMITLQNLRLAFILKKPVLAPICILALLAPTQRASLMTQWLLIPQEILALTTLPRQQSLKLLKLMPLMMKVSLLIQKNQQQPKTSSRLSLMLAVMKQPYLI